MLRYIKNLVTANNLGLENPQIAYVQDSGTQIPLYAWKCDGDFGLREYVYTQTEDYDELEVNTSFLDENGNELSSPYYIEGIVKDYGIRIRSGSAYYWYLRDQSVDII